MVRKAIMAVGVFTLLLDPGSWGQNDATPHVTGTVNYLQRSALPRDAVVLVQLQDVSFQDVQPAKIIAEQTIPLEGKQVPVPFRLSYAEVDIDPAHSYAVRATISSGGKLLFTSTSSYPVITSGAPKNVEIRVQPSAASSVAQSGNGRSSRTKNGTNVDLLGIEWKLSELAGEAVPDASEGHGASLALHEEGETLSGSSGCNRLIGTFKLHGRALYFEPVGLTRMACAEPAMKLERAFLEALNATTRYAIAGDELELRRDEEVLAKFRASAAPGEVTVAADASGNKNRGNAGDKGPNSWLGQWDGPEGTYIVLSKNGDKYSVDIRSLDGVQSYQGVAAGDHIQFAREGATETIRAGNGEQTGMKWLAGKKNCLVVKSGEGYCRE